jgi:hypothetical protein
MCAYLYAEKCPWTEATCTEAAINRHSSTLRWLREHGCPWDTKHIHVVAAQGGSIDVMVYLQQQGIVFTAGVLTEMLSYAGAYNHLAAAKWLRAQGAEWPAMLCWGHQRLAEILEWARAEGCTSPLW